MGTGSMGFFRRVRLLHNLLIHARREHCLFFEVMHVCHAHHDPEVSTYSIDLQLSAGMAAPVSV
jgi:hypothetical protein